MKDIRISVQNKIALNRENDTYVCGNSDYRVVFDFDEEWDAYHIKTARFKYNGVYQEAVFTGNECAVPIIQDARMIHVGVYAGNISTSTPAVVIASRSILSGDEQHQEPEYDVYEQLVKLVEAGAVRGEPGPQGPQGEVGPAGSDAEVTAENIGKALGFTPADVETVNQVKNDLADLGDEVNGTLAVGKNKLNPATISSYSVINDSGEIVSSTVNHSVSDKIPIGDIRHVVLSYLNSSDSQGLISESDPNTKIAFYRSDDSFISFASTRNEDVPSDAEYLRVQIS